ncbi:MAG: ATP-binding protein [Parabacteroides sp.]|nr:ATP-binding protein [Parabacteroides sp.]MDY6004517.1 ATP-binding protein [Parabacteroides sp.]
MKYPIGIQSFDRIRNEGYVYVDKTDLIYQLVTTGSIYFLSRPRRFGKSLLVSTLEHYFLGHKELFKGLAMEQLEQNWYEYPVFHIDFNNTQFEKSGNLENKINIYLTAWEQIYGALPVKGDLGDRFAYVLEQAHKQTGRRAVVLVDEYDKPILDVLDSGKMTVEDDQEILLEEQHRNILKGFYSVFKGADAHLQFVLLTGVTKFSQVSVFSGFNQPDDISMVRDYESLCGITKDELLSVFGDSIHLLADELNLNEEQTIQVLKDRYDGYHFGKRMTDIFNPFSILKCFRHLSVEDYWFASGTPTYLVRLLNHYGEQLNEMIGQYYFPEEFIDYKATVEQPLPMIYQSGYLTIKRYNRDLNTYLLDFPNNEVKKGFLTLVASNYLQSKERVTSWIQQAVMALQRGRLEQFRDQLTAFLASVPYSMRRKQDEREYERYFQYTFYLLLRLLSVYTVYNEMEQSRGRVDCIVETPDYVYIFEFKLDGSAEQALQQIKDKGYARPYLTDTRKLYQIGVNFSSETGTIEGFNYE